MEIIEGIKTRRSRRLFLDKKISGRIINELIDCAISAPSSVNSRPWHFIIVKDEVNKKQLTKLKEDGTKLQVITAPVLIIVCVDTKKSPFRYVEDGVVASQNILLAAHGLGLGAVYLTGYSLSKPEVTEKIRKILNLPENIFPVAILPVGYPAPAEQLDERKILKRKKIVHYGGAW